MSEAVKKPDNKKADPNAQYRTSWLYSFVRGLATVLFHTLGPVKYLHGERVQHREGPYILICNHVNMLDPVVLAAAVKKQQICFLGKVELISNPILRWAFKKVHIIPVSRHATDMAAMRTCIKTLKDGHILGIFPEGTRHHQGTMEEIEAGVAMIALRSGMPVVPAYLPRGYGLFRMTRCYFGEDIPTADLRAEGINNESCQKLLTRITDTYKEYQKTDLEQL